MKPLISLLEATIRDEGLIKKGQGVLLALSGGTDSVALLRAFLMLGYEPKALHCNFHLRGQESDGDEAFVRQLCRELGVELLVKHFETEAYAREHSQSIEMAARELRYQWFQEVREEQGEAVIAVAHNADDMVETLLLNLSMGTGIRGLSGMPYKRHDGIIRPLMNVNRREILNFLSDLNQSYREDSSNTSLAYKRNFIRHKLIPCFEELNPNFRANTLDTISNLRGTEAIYLSAIQGYQKLITDKGLKISELLQTPEPSTILFELLRPYGFSREQILDLAGKLSKLRRGAKYESETHTLLVSRHYLELLPKEEGDKETISIDISQAGSIALPNGLLSWGYKDRSQLKSLVCSPSEAIFDVKALREAMGKRSTLLLRGRAEGDRIKPFGMKGKKKLSRIFIDGGFTHREREEALLLTTEAGQILWLLNILADSTFAVVDATEEVLLFTFSIK